MTIPYGQLRAVVLNYLKVNPEGAMDFHRDRQGLFQYCEARGLTPTRREDGETVRRIFHELYLERIIITGRGLPDRRPDSEDMGWPFYRPTAYGAKVINYPEYTPYDPDGYLARLRKDISTIDAVILRYAEEALNCLRVDCLLAASVMIGCAAEKAVLLLVEGFGNAISDPAKKIKYEKDTQTWVISKKFDALWQRLEPLTKKQSLAMPPVLSSSLSDDLQVILERTFDLIRTTRNEAGHPTGKQIERETVHANLILFPGYCRRVYELLNYFASNRVV
jgi:hypothetical protein